MLFRACAWGRDKKGPAAVPGLRPGQGQAAFVIGSYSK